MNKIIFSFLTILLVAIQPGCTQTRQSGLVDTDPSRTETWSEKNKWEDSNASAARESGQPFN